RLALPGVPNLVSAFRRPATLGLHGPAIHRCQSAPPPDRRVGDRCQPIHRHPSATGRGLLVSSSGLGYPRPALNQFTVRAGLGALIPNSKFFMNEYRIQSRIPIWSVILALSLASLARADDRVAELSWGFGNFVNSDYAHCCPGDFTWALYGESFIGAP